jgi:RNA polymerase sigma factor (sigma-70 family)
MDEPLATVCTSRRSNRAHPIVRDESARNELVAQNIKLLNFTAQKYYPRAARRLGIEIVAAMGTRGLLRAASTWRPDGGRSFSGYAVPRIRRWIHHELERDKRYYLRFGRTSIDATCRDGDARSALSNRLPDRTARQTWQDAGERERNHHLRSLVESLPGKHWEVIWGVFFEGKTIEELRIEMNLSRERIRQLRESALGRLRAIMTAL